MGLDYVPYNLSQWKGKLCSTCKLFIDIDHAYLPLGYIVKTGGFESVLTYLKSLDMIVFNTIIMNTDRHYENFGLMIDNKTNTPLHWLSFLIMERAYWFMLWIVMNFLLGMH